jgi:transaldolase
MGASFKNANQVSEALISGADTVTVPLDILKQFASNDLAIHAVEVFNQHGKELNNINGMGNE